MTHPCEHLFDPTSFIRTCRSADFWQAACLRSWDPVRCPGTRNEQDTRWCPTQHSLPALQISHHLSMPSLLAGDLRSEQLRCFLQDKARDPEENVALKPHHMLWRRAWRWWKSHSPRNKWANLVCEFNPNIYMSYWIIIPNHQVNSNHHPKPPGDFFFTSEKSPDLFHGQNFPSPHPPHPAPQLVLRRLPPTPASRGRAPPGTLAARPQASPSAAPGAESDHTSLTTPKMSISKQLSLNRAYVSLFSYLPTLEFPNSKSTNRQLVETPNRPSTSPPPPAVGSKPWLESHPSPRARAPGTAPALRSAPPPKTRRSPPRGRPKRCRGSLGEVEPGIMMP